MTSIGGSIDWSGLFDENADLALEPDSIRDWIRQFGEDIAHLKKRRAALIRLADHAHGWVQLGEMDFSVGIKKKIIDRIATQDQGETTAGSLLAAIDNTIDELTNLHEALRRALATHLDADFEAERIMSSPGAEADG